MRFFLSAILLGLVGCATSPYEKLGTTLSEAKPQIGDSYSFAFQYRGDKYLFAPQQFKQGGRACYIYLGFKNEKLAYTFSLNVFSDIEKTYAENQNPDVIKKKILDQIQNEKPTPSKCYEVGQGPPPDAGQGEGIMLFLFPITVPVVTYLYVVDQIDKNVLHEVSSQVELGMDQAKVPSFIQKIWVKKTKGKYTYYELIQRQLQMIFYFENGKLDAWSQNYVREHKIFQ